MNGMTVLGIFLGKNWGEFLGKILGTFGEHFWISLRLFFDNYGVIFGSFLGLFPVFDPQNPL